MELKKTLTMPKGTFEMRGNLSQKEPKMLESWEQAELYEKMLAKNAGHEEFYLHDGPPYANGDMHCGHTLNRIIKDIIIRYKSSLGYYTPFIPGWDTHGLPIENAVQKKGIDRKKISLVDFRKHCEDYAYTQVNRQMSQVKRLGIMGDFKNPYITLKKEYEAKQIEIFSEMALKGYIYKGFKPVYWSWSSESALAEAEIEYHDVKAKTIYVKFPIIENNNKYARSGDSFVCWTTTPWTIPANLAVCLNPNLEYGVYETDQGRLIFLVDTADTLIKELNLTNVKLRIKCLGKEFEYLHVSHPFYDRDSLVIMGSHVTNDGTGCVHTAPGHGVDDYNVGQLYHLPSFCPVDYKGYLTEEAGDRLKGLFYEEANDEVINMLTEAGRLLGMKEIVHSYPHDWRTNKPVIFRATPQWFCSIDKIRDKLYQAIDEVKWNPTWGKTRMHNMISMRGDWCISRQRAWGVPIPIFYAEDDTPIIDKAVFDNIQKLFEQYGSNIWFEKEAKDLLPNGYTNEHSPNGIFKKESDIMDVWFDSGSSFNGVDILRGHNFPADLYLEGSDQYRGWFNSSLILSVATKGVAPYKEVVSHGFVVDKNSEKMSKSKGNGMDPIKICNVYGADIVRLWASSIDYQNDVKISDDIIQSVSESYRKIRNTFKFLLANLHDDENEGYKRVNKPSNLMIIDEMILARLNELVSMVKSLYDKYDFASAYMAISNFMANDLSSFYLDVSKDVLYCDEVHSVRRKNIQYVLDTLAVTLASLLNPILPFTMQEVNDHLIEPVQTYFALQDFPTIVSIDSDLLAKYKQLLNIRTIALKALEDARVNKLVNSPSMASLTCNLTQDNIKLVKEIGVNEFSRLLNVSKVILNETETNEIEVSLNNGVKCDRCWNYFDEIHEHGENHLCTRCLEAIKKYE